MKFKYTADLIKKKLKEKKAKDITKNGSWLGKQLSYTPQFISNWQRCVSEPPLDKVKTLCMLLEISNKEILDAYIKNRQKQVKDALK